MHLYHYLFSLPDLSGEVGLKLELDNNSVDFYLELNGR